MFVNSKVKDWANRPVESLEPGNEPFRYRIRQKMELMRNSKYDSYTEGFTGSQSAKG